MDTCANWLHGASSPDPLVAEYAFSHQKAPQRYEYLSVRDRDGNCGRT
jgi:hypothetical protein